MLSSNNILSPANGRPVTTPTQDMVLGIYFMTSDRADTLGDGRSFTSVAEALMAFDAGTISIQSPVSIRLTIVVPPDGYETPEGWEPGNPLVLKTTLGRALFNEALPDDFPYLNVQVDKKVLGITVNRLAEIYPKVQVANTLRPAQVARLLLGHALGRDHLHLRRHRAAGEARAARQREDKAAKVETQYGRGLITDAERRQELHRDLDPGYR